ncbi:putative membrane protein [Campylobacter sp. RM5004]|uniref:hypothetical protein n=1 Tax=Campylobacter sp. RM5004 TaxID=1660078 RepID=UPI001EFB2718|nr:hypothetical protein [Campylobacter sp. RM5004]ULO02082.1 putative membrane protein [Campylobacter sp. RM5004]
MQILLSLVFGFFIFIGVFLEFFYFAWRAFKLFDAAYPLISLAIFTILILLIIKIIRKISFKKFLLISIVIISFEALFVRTVVDYSNFNDFSYVLKSSYEKDLLGYCVKDNEILSKDELVKRATNDFLDKTRAYYKNIAYEYIKERIYFYTLDEIKDFDDLKSFDIESLQKRKINSKNYSEKLLERPLFLSTSRGYDIVFFKGGFDVKDGFLEYSYTTTDNNLGSKFKFRVEIDRCGNTNRAYDEKPCFDVFECRLNHLL